MTEDDLAGYAPVRRDALCAPYRVFTVCGFPPPSSGGVATLQILAFLAHQDMPALGPRRPGHGAAQALDAAHLLGEAGRLAFADRNRFLADADVVSVPVRGLLDPAYLLARAQLLDRDRATAPLRPGNPPWPVPRRRRPASRRSRRTGPAISRSWTGPATPSRSPPRWRTPSARASWCAGWC